MMRVCIICNQGFGLTPKIVLCCVSRCSQLQCPLQLAALANAAGCIYRFR